VENHRAELQLHSVISLKAGIVKFIHRFYLRHYRAHLFRLSVTGGRWAFIFFIHFQCVTMPASLCIHVSSEIKDSSQDLVFFKAETWNAETEKAVINKIQDLLGAIRACSKSFEIKVNLKATNVDEAIFLLKKKINHRIETPQQKLSLREIEVLGLIMQGYTNNEIAEKLFVCYETVKSHRKNILLKTGAKNTAALISHYHQTFFEKDPH
jgi:DNA-binding CsgD family transcriptional regulator